MKVTFTQAQELARAGDLFAAAEFLLAHRDEEALRPLAALLLAVLGPLRAMGAVQGRAIDFDGLRAFLLAQAHWRPCDIDAADLSDIALLVKAHARTGQNVSPAFLNDMLQKFDKKEDNE